MSQSKESKNKSKNDSKQSKEESKKKSKNESKRKSKEESNMKQQDIMKYFPAKVRSDENSKASQNGEQTCFELPSGNEEQINTKKESVQNKKRSNKFVQTTLNSSLPTKKLKTDNDKSNNTISDCDEKKAAKKKQLSKKKGPQQQMKMKGKEDYREIKYKTQWGKDVVLKPSEQQLDIITSSINKDTKIVACAGSGKTTTLVIRLKYLLDHGVKAKEIMISTFNVEAGKHLRYKVNEIIGTKGTKLIKIKNIDKIALDFIQEKISEKENSLNSVVKVSQKEHLEMWLDDIKKNKERYENIKYFFFDEFQDISELQYQILMEFKKMGCILTVIGDDAQNIYGFRGTKIDIIQTRIDDDLKAMELELQNFELTINYRSTHAITQFANQIIFNSQILKQKIMQSDKEMQKKSKQLENQQKNKHEDEQEEELLPNLHINFDKDRQNYYVINKILSDIHNNKCQFKDIAILAPTNQLLKYIETEIESNNKQNKENKDNQIPYYSLITSKRHKLNSTNNKKKKDEITLTTIHKSKGLEWDIVYYLGCSDDIFPVKFVSQSTNPDATLEEQRRLFYVGTTRAGKELNFFCLLDTISEDKPKVSRFFSDIPPELYQSEKLQDSMITGYSQIKQVDIFNKSIPQIDEVIGEMTPQELRDINQHIQNIKKVDDRIIYENKEEKKKESVLSGQQYFLKDEMKSFYSQYITRMIGEKCKAHNAYYDDVAVKVILPKIHAKQLPPGVLESYLKYRSALISLDSNLFKDLQKVIEELQRTKCLSQDEDEIKNLKSLLDCVQEITFKNKPQLFFKNHMIQSNFLFKKQGKRFISLSKEYVEALTKFTDKQNKTENIYQEIHMISKCDFLFEGRTKYLHDNNYNKLLNNILFEQIQKSFIEKELSNKTIECKKIYKTNQIHDIADLIVNNNELIFLNFTENKSFDKEDFLRYTFAAATLRANYQMEIQKITIFKVFTGKLESLDITNWKTQDQYLSQMNEFGKAIMAKRNNEQTLNTNKEIVSDEKINEEENRKVLVSSITQFEIEEVETNDNSNGEQSLNVEDTKMNLEMETEDCDKQQSSNNCIEKSKLQLLISNQELLKQPKNDDNELTPVLPLRNQDEFEFSSDTYFYNFN